ncbi:zinc finger ZZ-type and EF-hand domain-containing protein 1-like [Actinia tenebrosa]|uniref:Zinc finger ZZ-type and EF-hand domain-containing protein 1-like n=1 Tax=Actinia tenebrosa TaxID=6105 RepID=A0A6P8IM40_ACTTE|nr:zinc finger ZZ-type and EF-hand domain-containing protein 1-like [Actinia tenebrosa]
MGNAPSGAMNDNDDDDADFLEEGKASFSPDSFEGGLDISVLFDHALLREAAGKIKEEANEGLLQQHVSTIVRWLEERRGRHDEYISLSQFTDMLVGRGANREECVELFNQFDAEGNGHVVVEYFLETLQGLPGGAVSAKGDLRTSTKSLQSCSLTPGFVDAFAENSETVLNHGQKLLKFLMRNRSQSTSLPIPALDGFCNTSEMRLKVLQAHIEAFKEKVNLSNRSPSIEDGEILKPLTKCYMDIEVSSNKSDAMRVVNNDSNSYWQSDGPARSHWVRLRMRPNVVLKQLSINVASADQSYMPQHVVIMAGRDEQHLREIGDVRIPSHITGDYTLIENVKTPYPIIQINIRRCHSDGCDTRVRGLKAIGFRVLRSKGMSVGDASAVWYLSILGATAQAALPLAPHLRDTLLAVTRSALKHMRPLSLSHSSPERPSFMSQNVMDEVESFLHSVVSFGGSIHPESLKILLEFTLARGSLKSILKVVKLLYDVCDEDFNALEIIQSLQEVQFSATRMHGTQLKMSLVSCDGGEKDKNSKPENVLSENWTSEAYLSENGKKLVNMTFSCASSNPIKLTKLVLKVYKGAIGPKAGIVFVLNDFKRDEKDKEPSDTDLFSKYNNWTKADYTEFLKNKSTTDKSEEEPVAFFTTESDWDEVEVTVDTILTGKYILIKFLGPRKEPSDRIGVVGVHFFGYELKPDCSLSVDLKLDELAPLPESNPIDGSVLFLRILAFLDEMAKDQVLAKSKSNKQSTPMREKEGQLEISSVTLELLWDIYGLITSRGIKHRKIIVSSVLLLRLLYLSLPHLKPMKMLTSKKEKENASEKQLLSSKVFTHLCDIVDDDGTLFTKEIQQISKQIILEGAEVFFPDTETRRNHLLSMVDQVMGEGKAVSLAMTFESLCRFFSNKDASGLLGLPDILPEGFNCTPVISVMTTLLSVAYQECIGSLQSESSKTNHSTSNLVQLLCAMQKSLLLWCYTQLKDADKNGKESALTLVQDYTAILANKVCSALQTVSGSKCKMTAIDRLEHSFVAAATRQFVLFLNLFTGIDDICLHMLRSLHPIILELKKLSTDLPDLFFKIDSEEWNKAQGETVLRTWDEESNHDYENNQDISKVFSCPGCSEFTVEFDPQCETERKYDYLEFTDSNGNKRRFDQKVGTDKWPLKIQFKAGDRLLFYFHSDGSNSEWGYKFKVTAKGSPDIALSWIFDLQLGMARLFGVLCSAALDSRKASLPPSTAEVEEDDSKLLHSEIWTTLFRGGYMTGKLQRSLSGHYSTSPPQESAVNSFLHKLIEGEDATGNELVKCCLKPHPGPSMGGLSVDKAVNAVFAALIWHSQELREQVVLYANNTPPESVPLGIQEAYSIAESLRRTLVDRRQKLILQSEEEDQQGTSGSKTDPDSPVTSCREKAQFLLKFGGLQRLTDKSEGRDNKRSKWLSRKSSWHKSSSNENLSAPISINNATRQRAFSVEEIKTIDKHPAFKLIIDFVTNESYSHERIRRLLQQRYKHANTVADIYLFASDFLRISSESDVVQAPAVLFLQQFLSMQKYFPSHYADNLDGCGLALEGKVRRAYYTLVRRGLDAVKSYSSHTTDLKTTSAAFECLRAYVLHLLDTEWKAYDYAFIVDVHLPEFLLDTAKSTVQIPKMDMNDLSEKQELEHYEDCMKWFEEAKNSFDSWWRRMQTQELNPEEKRQMHLFVAEFSDCLDVTITCDGCSCTLPGRRFRCLNCPDVDLCSACYLGGIMPEGHTEDHQVVDLRYKCNNCRCFIVGTRFHCNECEDFDLCLGCQMFLKFPARHLASHRVTKFPFKSDSSSNQPTGLSQTYTHHHAWLQFSALALSLANALNIPDKSAFGLGLNAEYMRNAGQLHTDCLELLNKCLKYTQLPTEAKEEAKATSTASEGKTTEAKNVEEGALSSSSAEGLAKSSSSEDSLDKKEASPATDELEEKTSAALSQTSEGSTCAGDVAPSTEDASSSKEVVSPSDDVGPSKEDVGSPSEVSAPSEGGAAPSTRVVSSSTVDISLSSEDTTPSNQDAEASRSDETVLIAKYSGSSLSTKPSECSSLETISEEEAKSTRKEETEKVFAKGAQERLLGLLGALLPQDSKLSHWSNYCMGIEVFLAERLLPSLYNIIRSRYCDVDTRSLAMGVLAKYLKCINPEVSDRAIFIVNSSGQVTRNVKTQESMEDASRGIQESDKVSRGTSTVEFLFYLGAEYLASSDLDAASGMASTLQQLTSVSQWQPSVSTHIGKFIQRLASIADTIELNAIFGLLVFAGFPDVVRMGSVVEVKQIAEENRKAVVLKSYPEKGAVMVIDIKSRRKKSVKEHDVESSSGWTDASHTTNMTILIGIVKDNLTEIKRGTSVSVERLWMLYLALKGLLRNIKAAEDSVYHNDLIKRDVIPVLINLSCKGTSFSNQWLLRDLEVLSLKLYKLEKMKPKEKSEAPMKGKGAKAAAQAAASKPSSTSVASGSSAESGGEDPYEGMDDVTKACFDTIHEAVQASLAILRAIYENVGRDREKLLEEVQRCFDGSGFQPSEEVKELSKKWEPKPEKTEDVPQDVVIDVGVVRYSAKELKNWTVEAKPEQEDMAQKLIPTMSDAEIAETRQKQARTKSAELLKNVLEKERKPGCTDYLVKVNLALSIIYARHLLAAILSDWPEEQVITSELLDKCDEIQLIGLLDIIQRMESKETFENVVSNVVRQGDTLLVQPLSLAATHCMGEETLSSETRESEHDYKNETVDSGKVHIAGASTLFVKFDPRCATEEGCDELILATSLDYQQNRHVFSGPQGRWVDLELPGDTLYYKFTSDSSTNDWGWKFVVTGGQHGRFKTGFSVLNALLSLDNHIARTLPVQLLWGWLVSVACCQVGQQRLMATGLLLRLLLVVSGQAVDSNGSQTDPLDAAQRPDLRLLKPLWALYTKMLEKEGSSGAAPTLVSPVLRGLTELFLVVENLAQDWGMAEDLVVGFTTNESLKRCFSQAVQKIGAIGIAIGLPNKASDALIQAALHTPPKPPTETKEDGAPVAKSDDFDLPFMIHLEDEENDDTTAEEDTTDDESSGSVW